jgi:hypothetical protein
MLLLLLLLMLLILMLMLLLASVSRRCNRLQRRARTGAYDVNTSVVCRQL